MSEFTAWRTTAQTAMTTAGFTATLDPATVNPPCVVVGPVESIEPAGEGAWDVTASIWLVHPAPGGAQALTWLETALPAFIAAAGPADPVELTTYTHPTGDLPAYRAPVTTTIDKPTP